MEPQRGGLRGRSKRATRDAKPRTLGLLLNIPGTPNEVRGWQGGHGILWSNAFPSPGSRPSVFAEATPRQVAVAGCRPLAMLGALISFSFYPGFGASRLALLACYALAGRDWGLRPLRGLRPPWSSLHPGLLSVALRAQNSARRWLAKVHLSSSDDDGEIEPTARQYQCAPRAPNYNTS